MGKEQEKTEIIRSPLKYQGSKLKLVSWIKEIAQFNPDTQRWIEPFFGSGVVGLNMNAKQAVVNDINPHVIKLFTELRDKDYFLEGMIATLYTHNKMLLRYGEDYYYDMRENFNTNFHPNTLLFLNHTCFNGVMRFNKKGMFNVPYGKNDSKLTESYCENLRARLTKTKEITKHWTFCAGDYQEMFTDAGEGDLIYLDPPYIDRNNNYFDSWTSLEEMVLRELVMNTKAKVVMSTWYEAKDVKNPYVFSIWGDMALYKKEHRYSVGQTKANRYPVTEALLTNF